VKPKTTKKASLFHEATEYNSEILQNTAITLHCLYRIHSQQQKTVLTHNLTKKKGITLPKTENK
jgi:3-polyprenyl-4-hydroxybenzoate decarboxylase